MEAKAFGPYAETDSSLSDRDIRRALRSYFGLVGFPSDLVVEEVDCWRGYVRADYICAADQALTVIEIKSDRDSLARFDEQVRVYSAIADRVTLVVGWRLAARALRKAPWWWQVLLAERGANLETHFVVLRDGARNPAVDAAALIWMLPMSDVRSLASQLGIRASAQPRQLREGVATRASGDTLREALRSWLTRLSNQRQKLPS